MSFNPNLCVYFDGVIHSYTSGWQGVASIPDDPVPDAICAMAPQHEGPIVQIYSSLSKSWRGRRAMKKWLIKHGLPHCYITEGILMFPTKKPAAFLSIDYRAICFQGTFPSKEEMVNFKPWNKE